MKKEPGILKKTIGTGAKSAEKSVERFVENRGRARLARRYPYLFAIIGGLGAILVIYGFNQVFDATAFFKQYPYVSIVFGLFLVGVGSSAYKRIIH